MKAISQLASESATDVKMKESYDRKAKPRELRLDPWYSCVYLV